MLKKKVKNYLASDHYRKATFRLLAVAGLIFTVLGIYGPNHIFYFITALGISLVVGTTLGFISGKRLGWPMGLWIGLLGGAILSPWITKYVKGAEASFYAAILGPIIGMFLGRWAELKDKKQIEKATLEGLSDLQKEE